MTVDWLGFCREVAVDIQGLLAELPTREARSRPVGTGEGGDETVAIDLAAENAIVARLEQLHRAGAELVLVSEELGERRFGADPDLRVVVDPIDGSVNAKSCIPFFSFSVAVAEEFSKLHRGMRIPVGTSGTGGGFKKFIDGTSDINDASRPIKESEVASLKENGIDFVELKVAIDGLTVVVNPENDWVAGMTVEELKKLWEPDSSVSPRSARMGMCLVWPCHPTLGRPPSSGRAA